MNLYDFLVQAFNSFLAIFPGPLQWLVTVLVLIGLIGAFVALVRHNALWLILAVVLLPFLIPVLAKLVGEVYQFFLYLIRLVGLTLPKS